MPSLQIQALLFLAILLIVVGTAIYFGIRYSSGRLGGSKTSEFILWASCATSLCFIPWADLIDTVALVVYVIAVTCIRLLILKRPFRETEMVFHLAILYLSLSRLDKVTGYGQPNQFLVLAQYVFLATVVSSCIYQIFNRAKALAIGALLLLIFPVSHFPIELARNLVAREMAPNAAHLYVTKLYAGEIYGLRFEKSYWVDRYSLIDGVFQKKDSNLLNGGGGTLDPQTPIIASWEWDIVKMLFEKQRAGK
jgi:hypothetical protein